MIRITEPNMFSIIKMVLFSVLVVPSMCTKSTKGTKAIRKLAAVWKGRLGLNPSLSSQ